MLDKNEIVNIVKKKTFSNDPNITDSLIAQYGQYYIFKYLK